MKSSFSSMLIFFLMFASYLKFSKTKVENGRYFIPEQNLDVIKGQ